jgi:uncharacterized protein (TIGR02266 family)
MDPEAGAAPQRRAFSRVPLRAKVRMEFIEQRCFLSEWAVNLSPGGMFVRTEAPMAPGQRFDFEAGLSPRGPRFSGTGEVLWVRREWESAARPPGFAVRFVVLEEAGRQAIQRLGEVFLTSGVAAMQEELSALAMAWQRQCLDEDATEELSSVEGGEEGEVLPDTAVISPLWPEPGEEEATVDAALAHEVSPTREAPPAAGRREPPPAPEAKSRNGRWTGWLGGLIVLLAAGGYLGWRRGAVEGSAVPATEPRGARRPGVVGVAPANLAAALPASPAVTGAVPFESLRGVTWNESAEGLWVVLQLDGELPAGAYRHYRAGAPPPREVVQLLGARRGYLRPEVLVGSPLLEQIRFGFHPAEGGAELRVVLDLGSPTVSIRRVETDGPSLRVLLGDDAAAAPRRADLPAGTAQ